MRCPEHVRTALAFKHPHVLCTWLHALKRFALVIYYRGRWSRLRTLQDAEGRFVWPNLYNTVQWLNERDTFGMSKWQMEEYWKQRERIHSADRVIKQAKFHEMIKYGLAPEIAFNARKDWKRLP